MSPPCIHPLGTILCIRLLMYDSLTPVLSDTPFSPVRNALKFAHVKTLSFLLVVHQLCVQLKTKFNLNYAKLTLVVIVTKPYVN